MNTVDARQTKAQNGKIEIRFYNGVNGIKPVTHRDAIMALALEGGFHDISHALLAFNNNDVRHDYLPPLPFEGAAARTVDAVGAVATEGSAPLAAPIVFWEPPPELFFALRIKRAAAAGRTSSSSL